MLELYTLGRRELGDLGSASDAAYTVKTSNTAATLEPFLTKENRAGKHVVEASLSLARLHSWCSK